MLYIESRPDNIKLFLEALRSGKYTRCKNRLRDGDSFCPLGVACDVYMKNGNDGGFEWALNDDNKYMFTSDKYRALGFNAKGFEHTWPDEVNIWYGLKPASSFFIYAENDIMDKGFVEIADFIEENCVDN